MDSWQNTLFLQETRKTDLRGWILDIMNCIDTLGKDEFTLQEMYNFENILIIPPFSPIFIIPSQRVSTPVSPSEISKPIFAISKVLETIEGKTPTSPKKINFISPTTNAIKKKATQI